MSTNNGLSKELNDDIFLPTNGVVGNLALYSCGRANVSNFSLYINYRIWGPLYLKSELFAQTNNQPFVMQYSTYDWYYNTNNGNSYYKPTSVVYDMDKIYRSIGLAAILNLKLSNFDLYSGIALPLFQSVNSQVDRGLDVYYDQPSYLVPEYTNDGIFSSNINAANSYPDSVYASNQKVITPIFGLQYHLNAFNFGYRRSYRCHQLTLGYDIGRYRYE